MQESSIERRIHNLVKQGYTQAAFKDKKNADIFANKWREKGYVISGFNSPGPTIENPDKRILNAIYVIATKKKEPTTPHIILRPKTPSIPSMPPRLLSGTGKTRVIKPVTLMVGEGASRSTGLKSVKVGQVFHTNAGGGTVLSRRSLRKTRRRRHR